MRKYSFDMEILKNKYGIITYQQKKGYNKLRRAEKQTNGELKLFSRLATDLHFFSFLTRNGNCSPEMKCKKKKQDQKEEVMIWWFCASTPKILLKIKRRRRSTRKKGVPCKHVLHTCVTLNREKRKDVSLENSNTCTSSKQMLISK